MSRIVKKVLRADYVLLRWSEAFLPFHVFFSLTITSSFDDGKSQDHTANRNNDPSAAYAIKISSSKEGVQHARNEAAMMRRVAHPNALKLIEVGDTDDEVVLVTPYIEGGNLLDYLRSVNRLDEDHARSIFLQLVGVLHQAPQRCRAP